MKFMERGNSVLDTTFFSLSTAPLEIARTLHLFSSKELTWEPKTWDGIPGEHFTAIEQICHLRDVEIDGYQERIRAIIAKDNPFLPSIKGYGLSIQKNYKNAALNDVIEEFKMARAQTLKIIDSIEKDQWSKTGELEGYCKITLSGLINFLCSHDYEHLASLRWLLGKIKEV
ncbi:MAG TPA: DinB family protein [Eudoraea sp.]|nr:DinB family protein [Eudoraea sp.]